MVRAALPYLRSSPWGRVVAITSAAVKQPLPNLALSSAIRAATAGFAKAYRQRSGRRASRSTACCRGPSQPTGSAPLPALRPMPVPTTPPSPPGGGGSSETGGRARRAGGGRGVFVLGPCLLRSRGEPAGRRGVRQGPALTSRLRRRYLRRTSPASPSTSITPCPHHGRDAVLAGHDRAVAQDAAGVGDDRGSPGSS